MASRKRRAYWLFSFLAVTAFFFLYGLILLPEQQRITTGERVHLELAFPANLLARCGWWQPETEENWPIATKPGQLSLKLRLLGLIPVKTVVVEVVEPPRVIPGGHAIGVLLRTSGAVVVGYAPVVTSTGETVYPARQAGLLLGDTITGINGWRITSDDQAALLIDRQGRAGQTLRLTVRRGRELLSFSLRPVFCRETGRYRIGLYIRDSAAGVGTLTFYLPERKVFGALGHMVVEGGADEPVPLSGGRIVEATIQGIQHGRRGQPGEKIGLFLNGEGMVGSIKQNTRYGIFGTLERLPQGTAHLPPVPVALAHQVRPGAAEMLTVINGKAIERFAIEIERVMPQRREEGKGLVLRITDPRLLALTGGIVQGMSGSPILQDGALVGAVTHVFVQDPARGYGVFAEWMLQESGLFSRGSVEKPKTLAPALRRKGFPLRVSNRLNSRKNLPSTG